MLTAKELREKLANVPDDAIVVTPYRVSEYNTLYYTKNNIDIDYGKHTLDAFYYGCFMQNYDEDSETLIVIS